MPLPLTCFKATSDPKPALKPLPFLRVVQTVLQQRELRGMGVRARAVAALLRVFSLRVLALAGPSFQVSFLQPVWYKNLVKNYSPNTQNRSAS